MSSSTTTAYRSSFLRAASCRLRARDRWIGWSEEQQRRLPFLVNNCRFLLLPPKTFANLGSCAVWQTLDRLPADWQACYGHPFVPVGHLKILPDYRVRLPQSMRVIGMFCRFSNSLLLHRRSRQKNPPAPNHHRLLHRHKAEHHRSALRCLQARQPSFVNRSWREAENFLCQRRACG